MFQPSHPLSISVSGLAGQLKYEDSSLPQVMQGLSTFRICALTHHGTHLIHLRFPGPRN
jgi:hypothetical protein